METRVTVISDTHCRNEEINLPAGDLLIHSDDIFNLTNRDPHQMLAIDAWFGRQKFERILCTGGATAPSNPTGATVAAIQSALS